jgi:hypothetical protein
MLKLVGLSILSLMHEGRLLETFIPNYDVPFRYLNKLDLGWWKWLGYLVFLLRISEFIVNWFVLLIMKSMKESIYWDGKGNIFSFINKFLHDSQFLQPIIIQIIYFCILKALILWDELPQNGKP